MWIYGNQNPRTPKNNHFRPHRVERQMPGTHGIKNKWQKVLPSQYLDSEFNKYPLIPRNV
jgi:hypothetical protein